MTNLDPVYEAIKHIRGYGAVLSAMQTMMASNNHFTSGKAKRVHVRVAGGMIAEVAATFTTHLPDVDVVGPKRYRVRVKGGRWTGSIT